MPKMITKNGHWVTGFAMACGHVEQSLTPCGSDRRIVLMREGGIYHLRDNRGPWKGYHNIKAARKAFSARLRQNGLKRHID